jgi:uncharacterized membrane protein
MITFLIILQYLVASVVDVFDKFLISKRKIEPFAYTFFTLALGLSYLVIWPWVYEPLPFREILVNLSSGLIFAFTLYMFFKTLSEGEVSRVIPFVFGLVPAFDMLFVWLTGRNALSMAEFSALCLLVPGALLISYRKENFSARHVGAKVLVAFLFSLDYVVWQYGNTTGNMLNHLMWDRLAAAGIVILLLAFPYFRHRAFKHSHVTNQKQTTWLFLLKQGIGGLNFIFFSWLLVVGKIPLVNSLQGFRYLFLLIFSLVLSHKYRHILDEDVNRHTIKLKFGALALIFLGTLILFLY